MTDVAAIAAHRFPGVVVQRNLDDVIAAWLAVHGESSDGDVPTILAIANAILADDIVPPWLQATQPPYPTALPPYPGSMPRWLRSNEASDGWSILDDEKAALGGAP